MNAEEYIAALKRKNKGLDVADDVPVTVTARGLWSMVRQAWEMGAEHTAGKVAEASTKYDTGGTDASDVLFNKLFGGGRK